MGLPSGPLSLADLPDFSELRASGRQEAAFAEVMAGERAAGGREGEGELSLGCVVRLDRGFPVVLCREGAFRAEFAVALSKAGRVDASKGRAAVGDWVALRCPPAHDMGIIQEVLPRESDIARWRGGSRGERQTLAANVDVVLVVQALGGAPVPCDRIVRSAVIARDCGCRVAVVLTKADRAGSSLLSRDVGSIRAVLGEDVPICASCSVEPATGGRPSLEASVLAAGASWGLGGVLELVPHGSVAIVLGESGAGKSTLLNSLLGHDSLETGSVRASDDAGRHTTVARRMVSVPGGGVVVDEPGLRSLPLVGHERGLALVFPDLAAAARDCRFRDCTHTHEPGCAVRALLESGAVRRPKYDAYVALAGEMRASLDILDPDVVL